MIIDERTYLIVPGQVEHFLQIYEEHGLTIQKRILGNLVGYFTTDVGEVNSIVHLWGYPSLADREARRKVLLSDPDWAAYRKLNTHLIQHQSNRILSSTRFSPL